MTAYFSNFPDVYVGKGVEGDAPIDYVLTKNIFRRLEIREDIEKYITLFEQYTVLDAERLLVQHFFGDPFLDWTILLTNNITDYYDQWPKSQLDLEIFVEEV